MLCLCITQVAALLVARSLASTPAPNPQKDLVSEVRSALKQSSSSWNATRVTGKAIRSNLEHEFTYTFGKNGRFIETFVGPEPGRQGNDGKAYWQEDECHLVTRLDMEERDRSMLLNLIGSSNWLFTKQPVAIRSRGDWIELRMLDSDQSAHIDVDPVTKRPSDVLFTSAAGVTRIKLEDWRTAGDRLIPMHITVETDGSLDEEYRGERVEQVVLDRAGFQMPVSNVTDTSFEPGASSTVESRFAGRRHILVHPLLNGQDVGWFILDSGSGAMIVDAAIADSIKLPVEGQGTGTGVGGNVVSRRRKVDSIKLGPVTVKALVFGDYDMSQIGKGSPVTIAGIIGTALFERAVVTVDWHGPVVQIFPREEYRLEGGSWQQVRFSGGNPAIQAQVSGTPKTWYRVDTGGAGFLSLHAPFVRKYDLLRGRNTQAGKATGVGGSVASQIGTVDWFEFGGQRFANPKVEFSTASVGSFTDTYLAGNIGLDALSSFKIVFDFAGNRLALLK